MVGIPQILFFIALIAGGGFFGYFARRFDMGGVELWLPFGIIIAYAVNPLIGFVIAVATMLVSFGFFPYSLHYLVIMAGSLAVAIFATILMPVTAANFIWNAFILAMVYNIISNSIFLFLGYPIFRALQFIMLSLFLNWVIFWKIGWQLVEWLKA
ncbi:TPA: hypothetical protein H1012_01065 [archaeon]|nr:hypothetical protein [Candidatus Naiadarchaeales archaeon SRR2090159.bin1288]